MDTARSFKTYDIRGRYPEEVDERLAFIVGKMLAIWKKPSRVLVASDDRPSSPSLKKYLIDGLFSGNSEVFDLAVVPIPQFYFTAVTKHFDLGVMVTASHISVEDNGFKLTDKTGLPFDEGEILELQSLVSRFRNEKIVVPSGIPDRINSTEDYVDAIVEMVGEDWRSQIVAIDVSLSSTVVPVNLIFQRLGLNYFVINSNHSGNPLLLENQQPLARLILKEKAALGIIWDSDGDRAVFLDSKGELIPLSFVLGSLAAHQVEKNGGGKVAIDVRAGLVVKELVEEAGGDVVILPAWGQNMKFAMQADPKIIFGGETSGHFIFKDFYSVDDGILAALMFLKLSEGPDFWSKLEHLKRRYFELPEKNFPCEPQKATVVLENLCEYYRNRGDLVSITDGLSVFGEGWKFNLRQSLTEPYLRLNVEAGSDEVVRKLADQVEHLVS